MVDKQKVSKLEGPPRKISPKERKRRVWQQKLREVRVNKARAAVVRLKVTRAYEILEDVRLTPGLSDTAMRDKLTGAKRGLESMLSDFLLEDHYWDKRENHYARMGPDGYDKWLKQPIKVADQSPKK